MSDYDHILVEREDRVGIVTMNRPEVLNAMSNHLSAELHAAVMKLCDDDGIGCIVITGAGEQAFSAGGDIHEQREDDVNRTEAERAERGAVQRSPTADRAPLHGVCRASSPHARHGGVTAPAADEAVEWVDEHDRVIAVVPRSRMRRENLRHRSAAVVVLSTDGETLVYSYRRITSTLMLATDLK